MSQREMVMFHCPVCNTHTPAYTSIKNIVRGYCPCGIEAITLVIFMPQSKKGVDFLLDLWKRLLMNATDPSKRHILEGFARVYGPTMLPSRN